MRTTKTVETILELVERLGSYPEGGLGAFVLSNAPNEAMDIMSQLRAGISFTTGGKYMTVLGWEVNTSPSYGKLKDLLTLVNNCRKAGLMHRLYDYSEGRATLQATTKYLNGETPNDKRNSSAGNSS